MRDVLPYSHREDDPHKPLAQGAYFCGAVPMIVGTSILAGFATTHFESFVMAGLLWLAVGLVIVLCGFGIAHTYARRSKESLARGDISQMPRRRKMLLLLWLNFPVAFGCVVLGI